MMFLRDLAERALRAFVAAAIGALAVAAPVTDLSTARLAVTAAVAAGVSAVLSLVAGLLVPGRSASLDPANVGVTGGAHRR